MKLELHVFYVVWGYKYVLTAAEAIAADHPELELKTWDVDRMRADEMNVHQIRSFPTVRLFRDGVPLGQTSIIFLGKAELARWMDRLLGGNYFAPASARIK